MPREVTAEAPQSLRRRGFEETELECKALKIEAGAPVTAAVLSGGQVAAGFGDGTLRFFHPVVPPVTVRAHRGAVLCLAADCRPNSVLTGGDDWRFLRISSDGTVEEIAGFGTRWVDCVAAGPGWRACSSGRIAHLWQDGETDSRPFEHPSTVSGLAFDAKGTRLAVSH